MKQKKPEAALDSLIGGLLVAFRGARNMTQEDVSKAIKTSRSQIANIESGRSGVTMFAFIRYCRAVGVKPSMVLSQIEAMDKAMEVFTK